MSFLKYNNQLVTYNGKFLSIPGVDPYAISLINRMTLTGETPTLERQTLINNTIVSARTKPFWNKLDALWLTAAHGTESAKFNWVSTDYTLIGMNNPTFTIDRGFTGNSTSMYFKTGLIPTTSQNFSLNSNSLGVYSRTNSNGAYCTFGSYTLVTNISYFYTNYSIGCAIRNNGVHPEFVANLTRSDGLIITNRIDSTNINVYRNGTKYNKSAVSSDSLSPIEFYFMGFNKIGVPDNYEPRQNSLAFIGSAFTDQDVADMNTIFVDGYLNSIGAKI